MIDDGLGGSGGRGNAAYGLGGSNRGPHRPLPFPFVWSIGTGGAASGREAAPAGADVAV